MSFSDSVYLIDKMKVYNLLNDYKIYGKNSYVYNNPELLKYMYENAEITMNDIAINGEVVEHYIANHPDEIGKLFANISGLENAENISTYTTYTSLLASSHVLPLLEHNIARAAIFNSRTLLTNLVGNTAITELICERYIDDIMDNPSIFNLIMNNENGRTTFINNNICMNILLKNESMMYKLLTNAEIFNKILDNTKPRTKMLENEYIKKTIVSDYNILKKLSKQSNINRILENDSYLSAIISDERALYQILNEPNSLQIIITRTVKFREMVNNKNIFNTMINITNCCNYICGNMSSISHLIMNNLLEPFLLNDVSFGKIVANDSALRTMFSYNPCVDMIINNIEIMRKFMKTDELFRKLITNAKILNKICRSQKLSLLISRRVQQYADDIKDTLSKSSLFTRKEASRASYDVGQGLVKVANNPNTIVFPTHADSNAKPGLIRVFYGADQTYKIYEEDPVIIGGKHAIRGGVSFNDVYYQGSGSFYYLVFFEIYEAK